VKGPSVNAWCHHHGFAPDTIYSLIRKPERAVWPNTLKKIAAALDMDAGELDRMTKNTERWRARRLGPPKQVPCKECGTIFVPKEVNHRFHTPECLNVHQRREADRRSKECPPLIVVGRLPAIAQFTTLEAYLEKCASALGWGLYRFSEACGLTQHTLPDLVRNPLRPFLKKTQRALAAALHVDLDELERLRPSREIRLAKGALIKKKNVERDGPQYFRKINRIKNLPGCRRKHPEAVEARAQNAGKAREAQRQVSLARIRAARQALDGKPTQRSLQAKTKELFGITPQTRTVLEVLREERNKA